MQNSQLVQDFTQESKDFFNEIIQEKENHFNRLEISGKKITMKKEICKKSISGGKPFKSGYFEGPS